MASAVTVAVVLLASGACSAGSSGDTAAQATTTTSIALDVTGAPDLARLVPAEGPEGYQALEAPPFGRVTLERLLSEFSDSPEEDREILTDARYVRGYTRGWLRASPRSFMGVFVFEFRDEEGARFARDRFVAQNATRKQAGRFPVAGIEDAVGESYQRPAAEGDEEGAQEVVHLVTFVRGPRLYQVGGQFAAAGTPPEAAVDFARAADEVAA